MKKIAAILLMGVLMLSCVSCGRTNADKNDTQNGTQNGTQNNAINTTETNKGTETTNNTTNNTATVKSSKEILTRLWDTYEEKDTDNYMYNDKFSIVGGHHEAYAEGTPGEYDLTKAEDLEKHHCFPKEKINLIDDAATMVHLLNANDFSAAAYHVKDSANVNEIVNAIEDCVVKNQWIDDEPDDLLIVTIGDSYVLSVFGDDDLIHYFKTSIQKIYGDSAKTVVQREID